MKRIVFDAGPIISLTMNNLLWILPELGKRYRVRFLIPGAVKKELVDRPLKTKKFKFEALQVQKLIDDKVLSVTTNKQVNGRARSMMDLGNSALRARGQDLKVVQFGEMSAFAAAKILDADAVVVDERITRGLLEQPESLAKLMGRRLHARVRINDKALKEFHKLTKGIKLIRSVELVTIAYEKGILDQYKVNIPNADKQLLESLLWGVKLHGCAVSEKEIANLIKLQT